MSSEARGLDRLPGEIGIWIFIFLDLAVFALFFLCICYYRITEPEAFVSGHGYLNTLPALINTIVLLTGSLSAVRAVQAMRGPSSGAKSAQSFLLIAASCGIVFIAVKAVEYQHLFGDGITINTSPFFTCYLGFTMVHLLHVIIGTGLLIFFAIRIRRGRATTSSVESSALYWHMVDLLWLALFPLLYLM
ncbi:cytochrome c oxidase subunit 3 [Gordonia rubripertincta]|uniref:cytochrome c oxidase subunit 3 n=1 Tax=Gordonia rubripertincta TaxID=36822 RepID=UPI000B8DBA01|nr:cytochrome c oxidase subunit 3 [Gordonia rubripertincta]ASR01180.1 Cytochrome c oxidase subunit 3 [Gordonia rubripertincta]